MIRNLIRTIVVSVDLTMVAIFAIAAGCSNRSAHSPAAPRKSPNASAIKPLPPAAPAKPAIDVARFKPNELGRIPVLMYHAFGAAPYDGVRYDRNGLNIPPDAFRQQLGLMYEAGWYPINMRDAVSPHIDVPAGKIPVVLTFDDSRGTQYHILKDGSLDPDCGLAILEKFHASHPDWPLRGTFYILPRSKWNPVPFYQPGLESTKLQHLVDDGFEIANHSTSHRRMDRMDARTLAWEMAESERYVKSRAPLATMDTMALPMGYVPRTRALLDVLLKGADSGTPYENRCILRAWGGPTLSPMDAKFDKRDILRIGSGPGAIEGWIRRLKRGHEMEPFVSDGDPDTVTIPKRIEKLLNPALRKGHQGLNVLVYDDSSHDSKHLAAPSKSLPVNPPSLSGSDARNHQGPGPT